MVGHFTIIDDEEYGRDAEAFFPIFSRHNGELVAVDDDHPIVEGSTLQGRTAILAFADMDAINAWFNDPEYQEMSKHRRAGTWPHLITFINERPQVGPVRSEVFRGPRHAALSRSSLGFPRQRPRRLPDASRRQRERSYRNGTHCRRAVGTQRAAQRS